LQLVTYLPTPYRNTEGFKSRGFRSDATEESLFGCPNNQKVTFF